MNKGITIILILIISLVPCKWTIADDLVDTVGVKGGFVVHVGCEDGKWLTSLGKNDGFVVQGLSDNPDIVTKAREQIKSTGIYGKVSVGLYNGKQLPYVKSLVNLLIVSDIGKLSADEIKRVLVPGGVALIKEDFNINGIKTTPLKDIKGWKVFKNPWPEEIDEWTHFLHDAQGTSVSHA